MRVTWEIYGPRGRQMLVQGNYYSRLKIYIRWGLVLLAPFCTCRAPTLVCYRTVRTSYLSNGVWDYSDGL